MEVQQEKTVTINGIEYFSTEQVARLTKRSPASIRHLCIKGNRIRKMKYLNLAKSNWIEATELFDYPFTLVGKNSKNMQAQKFFMNGDKLCSKIVEVDQ